MIDPAVIVSSEGDNNGDDATLLFDYHDMFTETTMSIRSISVRGLDSFQELNALNPISNYTLHNSLALEYLTVALEMEVVMGPSSKSDGVIVVAAKEEGDDATDSPLVVQDTFVIEFTVNDVNVDSSLLLGINKRTLGDIPLGSVIHTENILPCALGAVDKAEFGSLSVTVGGMEPPLISSGLVDPGLDGIFADGIGTLFSMYEGALIGALPSFLERTLGDVLNDFVSDAVEEDANNGACPDPDGCLDGLVDYRDLLLPEDEAVELRGRGGSPYGDLFRLLYGIFEGVMSAVDSDGLSWLNELLVRVMDVETDEDGDIVLEGDLVRRSLDVSLNGLNAAIELGVSDVRVSNLDSLGALHLLQPMMGESSVLNNTASIGVGPEPLRLEMTLLIKGKGDEVEVHNEFKLGLSLKDVVAMLEMLAEMQEPLFLNFPLQDVTNFNCWMYTIVTPVLDQYGIRVGEPDSGLVMRELAVAIAKASLDMSCISCSSPMMLELEQAMQTQEGVKDTTDTINMLLAYGTDLLGGEYVQSEIDKMLNEAAYHCPHSPSYQEDFPGLEYEDLEPVEANEDSYEFLIAIVAVIAVVVVVATVTFFVVRCISRRRHSRWLKTLNGPQKLELARLELDEKEQEKDLNKRMNSLVESKEVPCLVRLAIPIVILGNIALFLSGHLSLGGTVNISGSFAGTEFNVEGFFEFSMAKSTLEMWQAGAKGLAIMIVMFSGVWPYSKLLVTLFIWFAPPKWLSSKRRGKILHWLDVLGKWSVVDVFVLLMTLASFNISVKSPDHLDFLPEDLYSINMMVVLMWGLYANMLAQLVAQLLSHIIIHYHRKTTKAAAKSQAIELNLAPPPNSQTMTSEKLRSHPFKLDYEASTDSALVRRGVDWILFVALVALVVLVICGCSLPSFGIEIVGIVGLVVESGNQFEEAEMYYSIFGLARMIMDQARYIGQASQLVGLGTLASLLVITVFIVPLAQSASLFVQWFSPMNNKQRRQNTVVNEVLSAWQYMEVYVLSIIIAAWQLGGVSEFIINAYCGSLKDTFASLVHLGILDKEDAQCFRVEASVEAASWLLVAASLILCILNHFIQAASLQKTQDDNTPSERRLHTDRWLKRKLPQSTVNAERVNTMIEDEAEGTVPGENDPDKAKISPIAPRFTDYYKFATRHQTDEQVHDSRLEDIAVETTIAQEQVTNTGYHISLPQTGEQSQANSVENEAPETAVLQTNERSGVSCDV